MKNKLRSIIFLILLSIVAFPINAQTSQQAQQDYGEGLPKGYKTLILDWEGVRTRMTTEQGNGKGAHWPAWLREGLEDGSSLYWWLLAQWHHNEGNQDLAYRTMLTAWTLTRMEASMCMMQDSKLLRDILYSHEHILRKGTTSNKAMQEAVLYSLNTAEKMVKNDPLRGMICNIEPTRRALERQRMGREQWERQAKAASQSGITPPPWKPAPGITLIDHKIVPDANGREAVMNKQKYALTIVSREFKVDQARDAADINTIMRAMNK